MQPCAPRSVTTSKSSSYRHPPPQVTPMYRISRNGQEPVIHVDQVEAIGHAIRASKPERYHVDQISADPPLSGNTSRRRGIGIRRADGSLAIEPDPWP